MINMTDNMAYDNISFDGKCGCYNCKKIFSAQLIEESTINDALGEVAICPFCNETTVVGEYDIKITEDILDKIDHQENPRKFYNRG